MKKFVSIALATIMMLCLSIPAFAAAVTETGDYTAEVTGNYVAGNESSGIVYCVNISWKALDVTYHAEKGAVWNPDTLEYSEIASAYWEGQGTITVTNRSNTRISAVPTYTAKEEYPDADMAFSTDKLKVSSAELGTEGIGSITVTPTGSLPEMKESATIGTITLTIAQDPDATVEEGEILLDKTHELQDLMTGYYDSENSWAYEFNNWVAESNALQSTVEDIKTNGLDDKNQKYLNEYYNAVLSGYFKFKSLYGTIVSASE